MNAYELADEYEYTKKEHDAFMESPTDANRIAVLSKRDEFSQKLIRQQADRIAELEKIVKNTIGQAFYEDDFHKAEDTIARQIETVDKFAEENARLCNRIAELEKQIIEIEKNTDYWADKNSWIKQSEPVAWLYSVNGCHNYYSDTLPPDDAYDEGTLIPLYTTPQTEPLSDEEIFELYKDCKSNHYIDFARAIEAKVRGQ